MKKRIVLLVLASSMVFALQAQVNSGIKGGIGAANARGGNGFNGKLSYKAGIVSDIAMAKFFSISPALYFSNKGYEESNQSAFFI